MRVVLDTNVLARATPGRNNVAKLVLDTLLAPPRLLITSEFMLTELRRILLYPRVQAIHGLNESALDEFVQALRDASLVVDSPAVPAISADPNDDPIIAAAIEGQADVLCTWDRHFHSETVRQYLSTGGVRVLRDDELWQELRPPAIPPPST